MTGKICAALAATAGLCASSAMAQVDIYFSDFEADNGGWTNSGTGGHAGDWEWVPDYNAANYNGAYVPPANAASGTGMWGTIMYGDHNNSGQFNILSQTFDFSGFTDVMLEFNSWSNLFTPFDYSEVRVNGDLLAGSDGSGAPQMLFNDNGSSGSQWVMETIDLSNYDGLANVNVEFRMFATTVVNRAGWYIDDVRISGIPTPGAMAVFGLAGLAAVRRRR